MVSLRKEENRSKAKKRKATRSKRTPQQQLDILDQRLGKGVGAVKERLKLEEQLKNT